METAVKEKVCTKCGPEKGPLPLEAFGKQTSSKDGHNPICKACINAYQSNLYRKKQDAKKRLKDEQIVISPKEGTFLQNQMNGLNKSIEKINIIKEKDKIDEALLVSVRPFYYFLISLKQDNEDNLILGTPPHVFCQTFFPAVPHAGLQLFNTFCERTVENYKFKRKFTLNDVATEFSTLIAISSLITTPSAKLIADDISALREMFISIKHQMEDILK